MHVGQTIAIPVLNRHITHSAGVCQTVYDPNSGVDSNRTNDCVMADAVRDRFKDARPGSVNVGVDVTEFILNGKTVYLQNDSDMRGVIGAFDSALDRVFGPDGTKPGLKAGLKEVYAQVRAVAPRVVHATVQGIYDY